MYTGSVSYRTLVDHAPRARAAPFLQPRCARTRTCCALLHTFYAWITVRAKFASIRAARCDAMPSRAVPRTRRLPSVHARHATRNAAAPLVRSATHAPGPVAAHACHATSLSHLSACSAMPAYVYQCSVSPRYVLPILPSLSPSSHKRFCATGGRC